MSERYIKVIENKCFNELRLNMTKTFNTYTGLTTEKYHDFDGWLFKIVVVRGKKKILSFMYTEGGTKLLEFYVGNGISINIERNCPSGTQKYVEVKGKVHGIYRSMWHGDIYTIHGKIITRDEYLDRINDFNKRMSHVLDMS